MLLWNERGDSNITCYVTDVSRQRQVEKEERGWRGGAMRLLIKAPVRLYSKYSEHSVFIEEDTLYARVMGEKGILCYIINTKKA